MVYLSCMTTTTSSDFPAFLICVNCGHEHQAVDLEDIVILDAEGYVRQVMCADEIKDGTAVLCADEWACERRMAQQPQPDESPEDDGGEPLDWEDHIGTNCPDDMYPDDGDGYYDTEGW